MLPLAIEIKFDTVEQCMLGHYPVLKSNMVDELCFQHMEKVFGDSVVPAITLTAHALNEPMFFEYCSERTPRTVQAIPFRVVICQN